LHGFSYFIKLLFSYKEDFPSLLQKIAGVYKNSHQMKDLDCMVYLYDEEAHSFYLERMEEA